MHKRQSLYYFLPSQNTNILIESDEQARQYLGIEWMETFANFNTQFLPQLLIKKMSTTLGFGVFALEDIQKDQLICLYTGDIVENKSLQNPFFEYVVSTKNSTQFVDAANRGNIGRFMQHLPNEETLKKYFYFYNNDDHAMVATANAYFGTITIDCEIYPALYAKCDISKFALIGLSYGENYWQYHCRPPELFHLVDSTIIHHQRYHFQNQPHMFDII